MNTTDLAALGVIVLGAWVWAVVKSWPPETPVTVPTVCGWLRRLVTWTPVVAIAALLVWLASAAAP